VRTEAEEVEEQTIKREIKYLCRLWDNVKNRAEKVNKGLVHRELGLTFQIVRDVLSEQVEAFLIDNRQEFEDVKGFVDMLAPELADRVRFWKSCEVPVLICPPGDSSLFRRLNLCALSM
jgi:ribonuclease G